MTRPRYTQQTAHMDTENETFGQLYWWIRALLTALKEARSEPVRMTAKEA